MIRPCPDPHSKTVETPSNHEAKIAISNGAEQTGTGVCSGEGGMLPEEQEANSRYFYEYATGKFGWDIDLVEQVQAFHFKAG